MIMEEAPPPELEEIDAVEYLGDYLTWVFYETKDRLVKGKGKGKGKSHKGKGKGKPGGKGRHTPGTFGVYGTLGSYLDHRRALQEARTGRGFMTPRGDRGDGRHRVSISELMSRTRCHQCKQVGHWARNCPNRRGTQPGRAAGGNKPLSSSSGPTAAMFFVDPPAESQHGFFAQTGSTSAVEQYMTSCEPSVLQAFAIPPLPSATTQAQNHNDTYLSCNYATSNEQPGRALIDTAAQHGLVGRETLSKMDQHLQQNFGIKVQHSTEDGGTVRGVCGVEEKTPIAYIPVGIAGYSGQLRVQIVPGSVPCLVPAYLLTDLGSVIDMSSMRVYHTHLSCMQYMLQRSSGHVEVSLTEFGQKGFKVPTHVAFGKSQVWEARRSPPSPPTSFAIVDAGGYPLEMPSALAPLVAALAVGFQHAGHRCLPGDDKGAASPHRPSLGHPPGTYGTTSHAASATGELHPGKGQSGEAGGDSELPPGRCGRPSAAAGATHRAIEIPGTSAAIFADLPACQGLPRGERTMGLGQVRTVRVSGTNPQVDFGPDAGMEHGDGVPEAELCDPAEQERGETEEEGRPARQQYRPECHQGATPRVFGTTSASSPGRWDTVEECGTYGSRERRRGVHWDTSRVRTRTPEFGTRPGQRLHRGHCELDAMRATCRTPPLHPLPGRRPDLVPPEPVRSPDLGVPAGRPKLQVHLAGQDSTRPDGAGFRGKAVYGVSAERIEAGDMAGPRSLAVRPMWRPDTRERVVGGVPRLHDEWRLQSTEPCEPPGKFQGGGALTRERLQEFEEITDDGWETLTALVDTRLCYFWKFCGTKVPGTRNAVLKAPLQKRILFNLDEGQPNVINIGYGTLPDYDLGTQEPIFVYVAQEFSGDFVQELKDVQFDPIEVTMDKGTKRALLESLDRICGPSFDEYLTACEDEHQNSEATTDATGWCLPTTEERNYWIGRAQESEEPRRWRRVGDNMVLCLLAGDEHFVPSVGPGLRHLRWIADLHHGQWSWREKGGHGQLHQPTQVPDTGTVVIYSTTNPGVQEEFASYEELTTQEKKAILRAHVNLGHPSQSEFVRLLKAAGCRPDVISYVQRDFSCSGCDLEKRPPTRLPASTPRTYDFNVVVGVDVLFVHGLDNRTEHPVLNITCHGTLYSTFGLIDHTRRSAQLTFKAFDRLWLRTFGPPEFMILDQGTEFTGAAFQAGLERHCVQPLFIDQDARLRMA